MLFARSGWAVVAQAIVAAVFVARASRHAWHDAGPWLPVYGTWIDAGCLLLLWQFTKRERIRVFDLVGFKRARIARDLSLGLAIIPPSLVCIFAGTAAAGWLLFGKPSPPVFNSPLPLAAALYGVLVWPFIWGLIEQMTYNGYLLPRFRVLSGNTLLSVAVVALAWSAQHAFMPLTMDARFMMFRLLSSIPNTIFQTLLYLRLRRLTPFITAHALMDSATVVIGSLLPTLRT